MFAARTGIMPEIDGATGRLYLDKNGRIHRKLAWAEFQRGEPVPLPDPDVLAVPILEFGEDDEIAPDAADDAIPWHEPTKEL